jgi:hypothetical protein
VAPIGDVIAIGYLRTHVLEMGQPENVNEQEGPEVASSTFMITGVPPVRVERWPTVGRLD